MDIKKEFIQIIKENEGLIYLLSLSFIGLPNPFLKAITKQVPRNWSIIRVAIGKSLDFTLPPKS